jgi:F-type H+-transporting ATPase subunit epsilon
MMSETHGADAATFRLLVATLNETVFDGPVTYVGLPGAGGALGVRKGHTPLLTPLAPGELVIHALDGAARSVPVHDGVAEVGPWGVTVLADHIGREARNQAQHMAEARAAAADVPAHDPPLGVAAVRAELDVELMQFFARVFRSPGSGRPS